MALRPQQHTCDRAREWVSLRLDDEISEIEDALLEAHLHRCGACREYEATVRGAVLALRARPLERMDEPIVVAGRRRTMPRPAAVARVAGRGEVMEQPGQVVCAAELVVERRQPHDEPDAGGDYDRPHEPAPGDHPRGRAVGLPSAPSRVVYMPILRKSPPGSPPWI